MFNSSGTLRQNWEEENRKGHVTQPLEIPTEGIIAGRC